MKKVINCQLLLKYMVYWTISAKMMAEAYFCPTGRYLSLPWQKPANSRNCQLWFQQQVVTILQLILCV